MKTLDEVIDIFEKVVKHDYVWFDEKTALMTIETLTDTLQYLLELRDMTDIPMEYFENGGTLQEIHNTSQISCPKCHSEFVILPESNNALTWDELKQMEGKPVWMEYEDGKGGWVIVGKFFSLFEHEEPDAYVYMYYLHNKIECSKELYGSYWKAYRKERS